MFARSSSYDLQIDRHELRLPRWDAEGFKVAVLSDLHLNSDAEAGRAQRAIRMAVAEKPDLVLLPGDFVNHSGPKNLELLATTLELCTLFSCPCVGVLGNHDYWTGHPEKVIATIRETPVKLLRNEVLDVSGVSLVGVDDAIQGKDRYDFFPRRETSRSCLAMLHEPDYVEEMPGHVSLQVSGHSHGGQICLPFGRALHTPRGARKYIKGFYENATVPLYVSRGVGTTGPDYRMFCPPEISVLTLRSA
jgi:uncharacterized protein